MHILYSNRMKCNSCYLEEIIKFYRKKWCLLTIVNGFAIILEDGYMNYHHWKENKNGIHKAENIKYGRNGGC